MTLVVGVFLLLKFSWNLFWGLLKTIINSTSTSKSILSYVYKVIFKYLLLVGFKYDLSFQNSLNMIDWDHGIMV